MQKINLLIVTLFATGVCSLLVGCKAFRKDDEAKYAYETTRDYLDDRAKPWVKDANASLTDEDSYLVDEYASDKIKNGIKSLVGAGPNRQIASKLMSDAVEEYERANNLRAGRGDREKFNELYLSAAEKFLDAAERWPKSSLEQDALFYAGESYFFSHHYPDADDTYKRLVNRYGGTRHMDTVQARRYSIAKYWIDKDRESPDGWLTVSFDDDRPMRSQVTHALKIFDQVRIDDPTGKIADDATLALANGYLEQGKYMDASDTYEDLRRTFPNSEHIFKAHIYELQARLKAYQGKDYESANLEKAEKLLRTMVTQFPTEARQHRQYLEKEAAKIQYLMAEREQSMADYYSRRGEYGAARLHLQALIEKYPKTSLAENARRHLGDIAGKPSEPAQKLAWLVNLFPEPKSTKPLLKPSAKDHIQR